MLSGAVLGDVKLMLPLTVVDALKSIKRTSRRDGDVLLLEPEPAPLFAQLPTLIAAAFVCELALTPIRHEMADDRRSGMHRCLSGRAHGIL